MEPTIRPSLITKANIQKFIQISKFHDGDNTVLGMNKSPNLYDYVQTKDKLMTFIHQNVTAERADLNIDSKYPILPDLGKNLFHPLYNHIEYLMKYSTVICGDHFVSSYINSQLIYIKEWYNIVRNVLKDRQYPDTTPLTILLSTYLKEVILYTICRNHNKTKKFTPYIEQNFGRLSIEFGTDSSTESLNSSIESLMGAGITTDLLYPSVTTLNSKVEKFTKTLIENSTFIERNMNQTIYKEYLTKVTKERTKSTGLRIVLKEGVDLDEIEENYDRMCKENMKSYIDKCDTHSLYNTYASFEKVFCIPYRQDYVDKIFSEELRSPYRRGIFERRWNFDGDKTHKYYKKFLHQSFYIDGNVYILSALRPNPIKVKNNPLYQGRLYIFPESITSFYL